FYIATQAGRIEFCERRWAESGCGLCANRGNARTTGRTIETEAGNRSRTGGEVGRVADEIPAIGGLIGSADVIDGVVDGPGLRALQSDDGINLPAFQHLCEGLLPGNRISEREREAMPDVIVAAGVLLLRMVTVLRKKLILIGGGIIEGMGIGVSE